MPKCERCKKGEAEWRCQECGRIVCKDCARPTAEGVFCMDHVPKPGEKRKGKKKGSKALKQLFLMVLFLTFGLALLVLIGDYLLGSVLGGLTDPTGVSEALRNSGWLIVYGMGGLTIILGLLWLASRRSSK